MTVPGWAIARSPDRIEVANARVPSTNRRIDSFPSNPTLIKKWALGAQASSQSAEDHRCLRRPPTRDSGSIGSAN